MAAAEALAAAASGGPGSFVFSESFTGADLKLIELEPEMLAALEAGKGLRFKADGDEEVVLCTSDRTFAIKTADTSNSLFLVPPAVLGNGEKEEEEGQESHVTSTSHDAASLDANSTAAAAAIAAAAAAETAMTTSSSSESSDVAFNFNKRRCITALANSYLEATPIAPRLEKLRALLRNAVYNGPEEERGDEEEEEGVGVSNASTTSSMSSSKVTDTPAHDAAALTWPVLAETIQASDAELQHGLRICNAVLLNGAYRILGDAYAAETFDVILRQAVAEDWPLHAIDLSSVSAALAAHEIPLPVMETLLRQHGTETEQGSGIYALDEDKVCRYRAGEILRATGKQWAYDR
eukprot:UC1_evm5s1688